jgi:hypothetical protein
MASSAPCCQQNSFHNTSIFLENKQRNVSAPEEETSSLGSQALVDGMFVPPVPTASSA